MKEKREIEYVIEIRFKPNSRILDKRGEIASALSSQLLNQWNISDNQIVLSNNDNKKITAIFSFKNIIFNSSYPNDKNFFLKNAESFIKSAWSIFPNNEITRIGVRTKFLSQTKDFNTIFESYKKNFLKLSEEDFKEVGGDLIDLGFPLNFVDGDNFFNIMTGPMDKEQLEQSFKDKTDYESAIFLDFDYFKKEFSPYIKQKDVIDFLNLGVEKAEKSLLAISKILNK